MIRLSHLMLAALLALSSTQASPKSAATPDYAVGPQYDTTHVYVPQGKFDRFVASFLATFGGTTSKQDAFQVTRRRASPSRSLFSRQ